MGKGKEKVKELNPGLKWFPDPKATQTALQNRICSTLVNCVRALGKMQSMSRS